VTAAAIFGCAGLRLSAAERDFFRAVDPVGFILFGRNVDTPDQVRALVSSLRESVGRAEVPVLIDQEGGRVARLRPPHWPARPAAASFGELYARRGAASAREAARLDARLIADDLMALGIDVACAPVLDLRYSGAHAVVGDRAFAGDPTVVASLAGSFIEGLNEGGVTAVLKHAPGHGRVTLDTHLALPVVDATLTELAATDFLPFRTLASRGWAMTAHIVYRAIDPTRPATLSPVVVAKVIRGHIGFGGFLLTDDLSMKALSGSFAERTRRALSAGCDAALHCNGDMAEMTEVASAVTPLSEQARERLRRAYPAGAAKVCDRAAMQATLDMLIAA